MAMLEDEGAIMKLSAFRMAYVNRTVGSGSSRSSGGPLDASADDASTGPAESVFARPLVLMRLAQFLQRVQVREHQGDCNLISIGI
jgi:hypothetical protein